VCDKVEFDNGHCGIVLQV